MTQTADAMFVTPSAVSHRVKQLEQIIGTRLFGRADFSPTTGGSEYLAHGREGRQWGLIRPRVDHGVAQARRVVAPAEIGSQSVMRRHAPSMQSS